MKTSRMSPTLFGRNHWMISSTAPISVTKQPVKMILLKKFVTLTAREIKRPRNAYSTKCIRSTQTSKLSDKYVNSRRGDMIRINCFDLYFFYKSIRKVSIKNEIVNANERRFKNSFEIKPSKGVNESRKNGRLI